MRRLTRADDRRRHLPGLALSRPRAVRAGVDELVILRDELGHPPLIGAETETEIFDGELHRAAGILIVFA